MLLLRRQQQQQPGFRPQFDCLLPGFDWAVREHPEIVFTSKDSHKILLQNLIIIFRKSSKISFENCFDKLKEST